jgi:hypothetical protein
MRVSGVDCRHCGIRPGLRDRVRDHFETAIRQADEFPHWLLQQTARNWYGRLLVDDPNPAELVRGRALIEGRNGLPLARDDRLHESGQQFLLQ